MRERESSRACSLAQYHRVVLTDRSAGVLLHPTSLPSGTIGAEAFAFVDWLAQAGMGWWQVLPLGPPDGVGSPYASPSAFAASPALISDRTAPVSAAERNEFREREAFWIDDWLRFSGEDALDDQVRFAREWAVLRSYAAERGVRLIGDVPIYVAHDGADHRAHHGLFQRGAVAGAPPDPLGPDGQHWGNPLYDWDACAQTGFRWWIERLRRTFTLHDLVRIDHFRGFAGYWAIPDGAVSAREGEWRPGPGLALFDAAAAVLGPLPVIAEDLGVITPDVEDLRDRLGFPGMAVLHWAFAGPTDNPHRLENHREQQVVYTGTHDTDTAVGWYWALSEHERNELPFGAEEPHWALIETAFSSRARLAVVQAQDVLGFGSGCRMNRPGTALGNWQWRLESGQLTAEHARRLRDAAERHGRAA